MKVSYTLYGILKAVKDGRNCYPDNYRPVETGIKNGYLVRNADKTLSVTEKAIKHLSKPQELYPK